MDVRISPDLRVHRLETMEELEKAATPTGMLAEWDQLVEKDTLATFFQTRPWCMTWYRCYASLFRPLLLVAVHGDRLVGIASLARGKEDGRLVFAGDEMCDYRDFVADVDWRRDVVWAFVSVVRGLRGVQKFTIGPTAPGSPTISYVVAYAAGRRRVRTFTHSHPCWRLAPIDSAAVADWRRKESIRRKIARYQKRGGLQFRRVRAVGEWDVIKEQFFAQHSLRQLFAGRESSFEQSVNRLFFDQLFRTTPTTAHFSTLEAGGRLVATHFGSLYKGSLAIGAPAFDLLEQRNSPGLLLLIELMRQCLEDGATQVDFTMGTEPYKARFGNHCVEVSIVDVYLDPLAAARRRLRDLMVKVGRVTVGRLMSETAWHRMAATVRRVRAGGWRAAVDRRLGGDVTRLGTAKGALVLVAPQGWLAPLIVEGESAVDIRETELADFLKADAWAPAKASSVLRSAISHLEAGDRVFTMVGDGRLAGYGVLEPPKPASGESVPARGDMGAPGAAWLWCELTSNDSDARLCRRLVAHMLKEALAGGAETAFVRCHAGTISARVLIDELGLEEAPTPDAARMK
jgi:CelD/BcsL family acetyltransferase involved in cellulose biosynthesis